MKKITLLIACIALSFSAYSQQTISFETGEGYNSGDINTQNGWTATPCGAGCNVANQIITADDASVGTNSLKIDQDPAFAGQSSPVVGAFYDYTTAIPYAMSVFSADINISEQNASSSDFIFGLVNTTGGSFVTYLRFTFEGNIHVLVDDGTGTVILPDTMVDWVATTWYNVKIEIAGTLVKFFIDGTEIYSATVATAADIEQVRFAHDNFAGFAYVDNFKTNNEPLSVEEFDIGTIKTYYNKQLNALVLESTDSEFTNIDVYDILGKKVVSKTLSLNEEQVNLETIQQGVYVAKVATQNGTKTIKFVKS
ncbi:T9SS type A sorting domain-containing protein [Lacinutrix chionoecetis]